MEFSSLYRLYARDVHRFALFLSGNPALADDLTAETFVRALIGKDEIRVDTVKAYLLAIARNLFVDSLRREAKLVPLDGLPEEPDPKPGPEAAADGKYRLMEVLEAMQQLSPREREALVLAVDLELPYDRIATILGCSVPALKVRVHRARMNLKAILQKERTWQT